MGAAVHRESTSSKIPLDPYSHVAIGRRCHITGGSFEGTEGIVINRDHRIRIVIHVGILGQGAAMEVDVDLLERV